MVNLNQATGKVLLGYAPEVTAAQASNLNVSDAIMGVIKRRLYHKYLSTVMEELNKMASRGDLLLYINGDIRRLRPFVSYFVNDHPEGQLICLVFDSAQAQLPCRACLTPRAQLHNWDNLQPMRVMEDVKATVQKLCKEVGARVDDMWRKKNNLPQAAPAEDGGEPRTLGDIEDDASKMSVHLDEVSRNLTKEGRI